MFNSLCPETTGTLREGYKHNLEKARAKGESSSSKLGAKFLTNFRAECEILWGGHLSNILGFFVVVARLAFVL